MALDFSTLFTHPATFNAFARLGQAFTKTERGLNPAFLVGQVAADITAENAFTRALKEAERKKKKESKGIGRRIGGALTGIGKGIAGGAPFGVPGAIAGGIAGGVGGATGFGQETSAAISAIGDIRREPEEAEEDQFTRFLNALSPISTTTPAGAPPSETPTALSERAPGVPLEAGGAGPGLRATGALPLVSRGTAAPPSAVQPSIITPADVTASGTGIIENAEIGTIITTPTGKKFRKVGPGRDDWEEA